MSKSKAIEVNSVGEALQIVIGVHQRRADEAEARARENLAGWREAADGWKRAASPYADTRLDEGADDVAITVAFVGAECRVYEVRADGKLGRHVVVKDDEARGVLAMLLNAFASTAPRKLRSV